MYLDVGILFLLVFIEMQIGFLSQEDPLEEEMTTRSSIFAWEIPWTEGPGWLQSVGSQKDRAQLSN